MRIARLQSCPLQHTFKRVLTRHLASRTCPPALGGMGDRHLAASPIACYKILMKIIEQWLLFKYVEGQFTPLSKPFKTKDQAEKARLKLSERERRSVAVGVIRIEK
jgi:hypothetical protein